MFKPFVVIATCCNTVLRMKTPGQFTSCECKKVSVDAGDGFIKRTIGDQKLMHFVKDPRDEALLMYWEEIESSVDAMLFASGVTEVEGCRDIHSLIAKRTGKSRQDAKDLLYLFNYTIDSGIKDVLFRSQFKARGSK